LSNQREYWERHASLGVTEGYELAYQIFPVLGLEKATKMAKEIGEKEYAKKWSNASKKIWNAVLKSPKFAMIENGTFIKRREKSGKWHTKFVPPDKSLIPVGTPLREEINNYADPDTASALPIAFSMIDPKSKLANKTLTNIEKLWNQRWNHGGYGRYNIQSEPDSPGPWPFASMFVTRAYFETENAEKVIRNLDWMIEVGGNSGAWFEFYGWRPIPPCPPPGVIPWCWAEVLICLVYNMLGIRPEKDVIIIRPKILNLTNEIDSKFTIAGKEVNIKISSSSKVKVSYALLNEKKKLTFKNGQIEIPKKLSEINLEIYLKGK
jgi:GH15 family glucan-1,4-alpha-glucosidase